MLLEKRAKRLLFAQDDVIAALESVFRAALVSERIIDEAAAAHRAEFIRRTGVVLSDEPYLEIEKLNLQLQFLNRMEGLFTRTESYLLRDHKRFYPANGEEWRNFDRHMVWKAFELDEPLTPQVERRIAVETQRIATRTRQRLDEQRQRAAGIEYYIWRSSDDDKVRGAHAEYDDQIFRWDNPPPDGHPGAAYGCRCHAEP